jgi:CSLREA domain-containing protein
MTLALLLSLLAQSSWSAPAAEAAVATGASVVVNSLDDEPYASPQCESPSDPCTLRAAVETAPAGATITFAVGGTVALVSTLAVRQSLSIDGVGQRVTLQSPPTGTAVLLGAGSTGETGVARPAPAGARPAVARPGVARPGVARSPHPARPTSCAT